MTICVLFQLFRWRQAKQELLDRRQRHRVRADVYLGGVLLRIHVHTLVLGPARQGPVQSGLCGAPGAG